MSVGVRAGVDVDVGVIFDVNISVSVKFWC